jgi:hypothetical protein
MPTPQRGASGRQVLAVLGFTLAYVLVAVVAAFVRGNREFLFYLVVMAILIGVVWLIHREVRLNAALLWALSVWGLLHMAGGLVPYPPGDVLYNLWFVPERLKYDQVVHAYGFATTTVLCWQSIRGHLPSPPPLRAPLVICAAAGMGFGALNEVVEFTATLIVEDTNVGGYRNTGWDLVANLTGSVGAAVGIVVWERSRAR